MLLKLETFYGNTVSVEESHVAHNGTFVTLPGTYAGAVGAAHLGERASMQLRDWLLDRYPLTDITFDAAIFEVVELERCGIGGCHLTQLGHGGKHQNSRGDEWDSGKPDYEGRKKAERRAVGRTGGDVVINMTINGPGPVVADIVTALEKAVRG